MNVNQPVAVTFGICPIRHKAAKLIEILLCFETPVLLYLFVRHSRLKIAYDVSQRADMLRAVEMLNWKYRLVVKTEQCPRSCCHHL